MAQSAKVKLNNPALLTWARESAGYQLQDIADRLRQPVHVIEAWERGTKAPTYRQLQEFAKRVKRPVAVLFLPEVPDVPGPPDDLRVLPGREPGAFEPETLLAFRRLRNSMAHLRDLLTQLGDPLRLDLPQWEGLAAPVTERGLELRQLLGVSMATQLAWPDEYVALNEWRDALFDRGVLVQVLPMPIKDARGFALLAHDLGGVGLSREDAPKAKPFSLFHEVAHLCFRMSVVSGYELDQTEDNGVASTIVERYCNAIAAEVLLPRTDPHVSAAMCHLARNFGRSVAESYAVRFKVSKYVLAYRLHELGMVAKDRYWDTIKTWRDEDARAANVARQQERKTGGPDSVRTKVSHAGKRYVAKVLEAMARGVVTSHEAGKLLSLKPEQLTKAAGLVS